MKTILKKVGASLSQIDFNLAFFLALLLPSFWFAVPYAPDKYYIATLLLLLAIVFYKFKAEKEELRVPRSLAFLFPAAIAFFAFLSSFVNFKAFIYSFFDNLADSSSILFILLFTTTFYLVYKKYKNLNNAFYILLLAFSTLVNSFFILSSTSYYINLPSSSLTFLGSVNELAVFFVFSVIVSVFGSLAKSKTARVLSLTNYILSLIVAAMLNLGALWVLLFAAAVIVLTLEYSFSPKSKLNIKKILSYTLLFVSSVFLLFGAQISKIIAPYLLKIATLVKPTIFSSYITSANALNDSILAKIFGYGPASFTFVWDKYKPLSAYLDNEFWDITFSSAYSSFITFINAFGFIGALLLLLFVFSLFALFFKSLYKSKSSKEAAGEEYQMWLAATVVYILSMLLFNLSILNALVFAFALAATYKIAIKSKILDSKILDLGKTFKFIAYAKYVFILLIFVVSVLTATSFSLAYFANRSTDFEKALSILKWAKYLSVEKDLFASSYVAALDYKVQKDLSELANAIQSSKSKKSKNLSRIKLKALEDINEKIKSLKLAYIYNPRNYRTSLALANAYLQMYTVNKSQNTLKEAKKYANKALALAPSNPKVHYYLATIALAEKDYQKFIDHINTAINIKPDFDLAYSTLLDYEISKGNLKNAEQVAKLAISQRAQNSAQFIKTLAYIYTLEKKYKEAENTFITLSRLQGLDVQDVLALVNVYINLKEYKKAKNALESLEKINKDPRIATIIKNLKEKINKAEGKSAEKDSSKEKSTNKDKSNKEEN